jgi:hypothetical protein
LPDPVLLAVLVPLEELPKVLPPAPDIVLEEPCDMENTPFKD